MPITKQLLQLGRSAHAHYVLRLDKEEAQTQLTLQKEPAAQMEAQKQQLAKEKKDLKSKEKQLERQEAAQQECMEDGNAILKEPNAKLRAAMRHKDFKEVSVAQAMIEALERSVVLTKRCSRQGSNSSLSKRRQTIINTFLSQPSKPKFKKT